MFALSRAAAVFAATTLLATAAAARGLSPRERAGKRIYFEGVGASGGEVRAFVGAGTPAPASALTCASCHGEDGTGRPEGNVLPSAITWAELAKRYGHVHPGGRKHPAFDERSVVRAVTTGLDPAGNALDLAMPRYSLSREDSENLVAYLKALERDAEPGVSAASLRVATVLPTGGRLAAVGAAMQKVIEASFAEVNGGGGIHGRRLVLAVAGYDADRGGAAEALRALVAKDPPFALVSGLAPGAGDEIAALAEREKLPLVAPFGAAPPSASAGRYAFYALAGVGDQARVLARWAARDAGAAGRTAVLHAADAVLEEAGRAAAADLAAAGLAGVEVVRFEGGRLEAPVERLARAGVEHVLFLGDDADLRAFTARADAARWAPRVIALGMLVARAAAAAPASFDGRVFLAYPSLPPGGRAGALEAFERLRRTAGVVDGSLTAQVAAFTAAAVLEEGLRRTGRALTRERLVDALERLYRFDTGLVPPLTFGPARRVGSLGGYVVSVDASRGTFTPVSGWIALE